MKILIIDDSETMLLQTRSTLEGLGHAVTASSQPNEVMQLYMDTQPDLIILDVVMDGLPGYECISRIRAHNQQNNDWVPIIFLSASVDDQSILEGIRAGGDDYLIKPISTLQLQAKIEAMERITTMRLKLIENNKLLNALSTIDYLTQIPNRRYFEKLIRTTFTDAIQNKKEFALIIIDIDNFKIINDTLSHNMGDMLLRQVVGRIQKMLGESGSISRLGSDEFAIILDFNGKQHIDNTAKRLIELFQPTFSLDNNQVHITPSIGIACYPDGGTDANTLIKHAYLALYHARNNGHNRYAHFNESLNEEYISKTKYKLALRLALENNQFFLTFQPKYKLETKEVTGVEALIRWNHPKLGLVSPDEFIPIAEEIGIILQIGKWVIEQTCQQFSIWRASGFTDLSMAINLSPNQLVKENLVNFLKDTLEIYNIPANKIELEITETAIMSNNMISEKILNQFHNMGVTLAIDDFGTGYSSLSHIKKLPVDTLKIDKSFVSDIPNDPNDIAIVESVILLSKSLGLHVIAEGIETEAQLNFLVEHGCTEGQGFYLSKPLSTEETTALLNERKENGHH